MDERNKTRRYPLAMVVAVVALFASVTGVVAFAQPDGGDVFTGCLNENSGVLRNVAVGSAPAKPCNDAESPVTWDWAGPAFEARIAELEERVAGLEEPFRTLELFVDCAAGDTVGAALAEAETHLGPVSITIAGVCEEHLDVTRDDVFFQGTQRSDGIRAALTDPWTVGVFDARRVRFFNMTVSGGGTGLGVSRGSTVEASEITVRDGGGIGVGGGSSAQVNDCVIIDNDQIGVQAGSEGSISLHNCEITGNGEIGVFAGSTGNATIVVSDSYIAHHGWGLQTNRGGNIWLEHSTVEHNNNGINSGGFLVISGETRIANNGSGVSLYGGSSAEIGAIIEGNDLWGIEVKEASNLSFRNTIVRDNGVDGIVVRHLSTVIAPPQPETQILDNGGWGINCEGPPAVVSGSGVALFDPSQIVFSGNTAGDTNCQ